MNTSRRGLRVALAGGVLAGMLLSSVGCGAQHRAEAAGSVHPFMDVREQTREFHAYNREITLTPEQQAIMEEALTQLPAPCCSNETALTCCCSCNLAKSWWGLAKHLIADRGLDTEQVRTAVAEWFEFINPQDFSGDSCYTGGCGRPFHENGCGGMKEDQIVF